MEAGAGLVQLPRTALGLKASNRVRRLARAWSSAMASTRLAGEGEGRQPVPGGPGRRRQAGVDGPGRGAPGRPVPAQVLGGLADVVGDDPRVSSLPRPEVLMAT